MNNQLVMTTALLVLAMLVQSVLAAPPAAEFKAYDFSAANMFTADCAWSSRDRGTMYLAATGDHASILAITVKSGKFTKTALATPKFDGPLDGLSVTNDGARLTAWWQQRIGVPEDILDCSLVQWNVKSGRVAREAKLKKDRAAGYLVHDIDGDGRFVLLQRASKSEVRYRTWDLVTQALSEEYVAPAESREHLFLHSAFSVDGKIIAVQSRNEILLLDRTDLKVKSKVLLDGTTSELVRKPQFSPDGKLLATVVNNGADKVIFWDVESAKKIAEVMPRELPKEMKHPLVEKHESDSGGWKALLRGMKDFPFAELEKAESAILRRRVVKHCEELALGPFSRNGESILISRYGEVQVVDCKSGEPIQTVKAGEALDAMEQATIDRAAKQKRPPGSYRNHQDQLFHVVAFGPDDRSVVVAARFLNPFAIFPVDQGKSDVTKREQK